MAGSGSPRKARAAVTINGTQLTNVVKSFSVDNNNYFSPDKFEIELVLDAMPAQFGPAFWADTQAAIGIAAAISPNDPFTSLILGNADAVDLDLVNGIVTASGRDLSAGLIDTKTSEKFQNRTSSQIAAIIAQRNGLTPNVTATSTPSGRYYEIDHARLTSDISEWTLLTYLAQEEGFDVYVTGSVLNFVPATPSSQPGFTIDYQPSTPQSIKQGNFTTLNLRRSQTLAKDIIVKVVSWNSKVRAAFTATAKRGGTGANPINGSAQLYTFTIPGLTQDQAQQIANNKLAEISRHERVVDVSLPGELTLQPRQSVALTGTGTAFDQTYIVDRITRHFSFEGELEETITMKNHTTESTVGI